MKDQDEGYKMPVNGISADQLGGKMRAAHDAVRPLFPPHTGILIITFDFGPGGGLGYISNGNRADCIKMLEEWIANMRKLS